MFDKELIKLLREQIEKECNAFSVYYVYSIYFYEKGYDKIYEFLKKSSQEEFEHMDMFQKYYNFYTSDAFFPSITKKEKNENMSVEDIFLSILELEKKNSESINNLAITAIQYQDHRLYNFLQFFIKDQYESEDKLTKILYYIQNNVPLFELNQHIGEMLK